MPGTIRTNTGTIKGYKLEAFKDTFLRYLPIDPSQRHNPQKSAENQRNRSVTPDSDVTDQNRPKPAVTLRCDVVTDETGVDDDGDAAERAAIMEIDGESDQELIT